MPTAAPPSPGLIEADTVYTLAEVRARLKLGDHALRMARRSGLRARYIGRRAYYLGRDIIAFIEGAS